MTTLPLVAYGSDSDESGGSGRESRSASRSRSPTGSPNGRESRSESAASSSKQNETPSTADLQRGDAAGDAGVEMMEVDGGDSLQQPTTPATGEAEETAGVQRTPPARRAPVQLPPSPPGSPKAEVQEKFANLFNMKFQRGMDMNKQILSRKEVKNPAIYDKLKEDHGVDEYGTNYVPTGARDEIVLEEADYYEKLAEEQSKVIEQEERRAAKAAAAAAASTAAPAAAIPAAKERSRADKR
ncbi:putative SAP30-binding protein [Aphelenchoides fujianensis]|nr:putative SAP30-binding protein [Aphelenchoides fujianensis]